MKGVDGKNYVAYTDIQSEQETSAVKLEQMASGKEMFVHVNPVDSKLHREDMKFVEF